VRHEQVVVPRSRGPKTRSHVKIVRRRPQAGNREREMTTPALGFEGGAREARMLVPK